MAENMDICVGDRIQALDSLGRWELAKVVGVSPLRVTFIGWSQDWDRDVSNHEVRRCVPPLEEQGRSKYIVYVMLAHCGLHIGPYIEI